MSRIAFPPAGPCLTGAALVALALWAFTPVVPAAAAQVQDSSGLKRAFLDRYLDCAEAPGDAARLTCYDLLLKDIPAWLEGSGDTAPGSIAARKPQAQAITLTPAKSIRAGKSATE